MSTKPSVVVSIALFMGCGGRSAYYEDNNPSEETAGAPGSPTAGSSGSPSVGGGGTPTPTGGTGTTTTGGIGTTTGGSGATTTGGTGNGDDGGSGNAGTPSGGSAGSVDANCYSGLAVSGAECTKDCSISCGFGDLGTRTCTCTGGYYSSCHCPRPTGYLGAPTAPPCDTPDGRALPLRHVACDVEWAECVGNDPVEGSIPKGCVCLANPLNEGRLTWFCGSTNRWFSPK